jgi:nicotinamide riboside kinase
VVGVAAVDAPHSDGLTVAIVGAECSGKTTLTEQLAQRFGVKWVREYSRSYLHGRTSYDADDVLAIAQGQHAAEIAAGHGEPLLFADTDLVVIKVWWEVRYGGSHAWVDTALAAQLSGARRRCYLVPTPDIPWAPDPLREHPRDRPALHARYLKLLAALGAEYLEVTGSPRQRLDTASEAVERWLSR